MIHYFTSFYGPVLGIIVMGIICFCLGIVAGLVISDRMERRGP